MVSDVTYILLITWYDFQITEVNLFVIVIFTEEDSTIRRLNLNDTCIIELERKCMVMNRCTRLTTYFSVFIPSS